jgi:hypothetical protein
VEIIAMKLFNTINVDYDVRNSMINERKINK